MSDAFDGFSKPARSEIVEAQEQARELRSPTIEIEHLLLGITLRPAADLRNVLAGSGILTEKLHAALGDRHGEEPLGEEDAAALRSIGIDLDSVRHAVEVTFGEDALDETIPGYAPSRGRFPLGGYLNYGHIPFAVGAVKALELTVREAISRGDDRVETGHVLLGIIGRRIQSPRHYSAATRASGPYARPYTSCSTKPRSRSRGSVRRPQRWTNSHLQSSGLSGTRGSSGGAGVVWVPVLQAHLPAAKDG